MLQSMSFHLAIHWEFYVTSGFPKRIHEQSFYSWVLYVQLRFQLSSHNFHPQYLWQFSKQLADSYLVFFVLSVTTPGYPLKWSESGSVMSNSVTPWTVARQAPLSIGFSRPQLLEWVSVPFSGGSSQSGIRPRSPTLQADYLLSEPWLSLSHSRLPLIWSQHQKYTGFYL